MNTARMTTEIQKISAQGAVVAALCLALVWALPCLGGWILDGQPTAPEGGGSSGGSTSLVVAVDERTFPVLRLELGGQWTDFELKATTNNFETLCYYIKSSGLNGFTNDDTNVWVYFTDDYSADMRKWVRSDPATAIGLQLMNLTNSVVPAAVVCPSHECTLDWREWMSSTNNRLVW